MNVAATTPFLIVSGAGVLALMVGLVPDRRLARWLPTLTGVGAIVAAGIASAAMWGPRETAVGGNFVSDRFTLLLQPFADGCFGNALAQGRDFDFS